MGGAGFLEGSGMMEVFLGVSFFYGIVIVLFFFFVEFSGIMTAV